MTHILGAPFSYQFLSCVSDFKFAFYPPSMIAAASVSAAVNGWMGPDHNILPLLQQITTIDMVSFHIPVIAFTPWELASPSSPVIICADLEQESS